MPEIREYSLAILPPEAVIADAHRRLAGWSRAWTQVLHGLMTAGFAQIDMARALYPTNPAEWMPFTVGEMPRETALREVETARARFNLAVRRTRHANDELYADLFGAAECLIDAMPGGYGSGTYETASRRPADEVGGSRSAKQPA
jgi:hypothetical protein